MEEFMPATMPFKKAAGSFRFLRIAAHSGSFRHFHYIHFKQKQQHVTSAYGN
ncbi:MAG: hypothetical protein ACR2GN_02930 [Bacteroidia bacterium]